MPYHRNRRLKNWKTLARLLKNKEIKSHPCMPFIHILPHLHTGNQNNLLPNPLEQAFPNSFQFFFLNCPISFWHVTQGIDFFLTSFLRCSRFGFFSETCFSKKYKILSSIFLKLIYCFSFISLRVRSFGQILKCLIFSFFFSFLWRWQFMAISELYLSGFSAK